MTCKFLGTYINLTLLFCKNLSKVATLYTMLYVVPCHHGMARPRVTVGGTASDMEVAANKLNKQSRTADKGWSSSLGVG